MDISYKINKQIRDAFFLLREKATYRVDDIDMSKLYIIASYLCYDLQHVESANSIPVLHSTNCGTLGYSFAMREPSELEIKYLLALEEVVDNPHLFKDEE
jgi:hypothetical protein